MCGLRKCPSLNIVTQALSRSDAMQAMEEAARYILAKRSKA